MEQIDPAVAAFVKNRPWLQATVIATGFNPTLVQATNTSDWAVGIRSTRTGGVLKVYFSVATSEAQGLQPELGHVLTAMKRQSLLLRSCAGPDAFATAIGTLAVGTVGAFDARLFWNLAQRQEEGMRGILGDEDFLRLIGEVPELVIPPPPPPPVVPATPRVADASPVVSVQTPPTSLWDL